MAQRVEDCLPNYKQGVFEWKRRMGEHLAYHQSPQNKVVHLICIPLVIYGKTKKEKLRTEN
jgi:hypothetical protein